MQKEEQIFINYYIHHSVENDSFRKKNLLPARHAQ